MRSAVRIRSWLSSYKIWSKMWSDAKASVWNRSRAYCKTFEILAGEIPIPEALARL